MKRIIFILVLISLAKSEAQNFWLKTNFPTDNSQLYSVYSMITNSSDELLAGTFAKGIFKSTDQGNTWSQSGLDGQWVISFAKSSDGIIYAGSVGSTYGSGIFKSIDGGTSWTKVLDLQGGINCVYVDSDGNVYVGLNYSSSENGIYFSSNGGANWQNIFNDFANIYTIIRLKSGRILAASYGKIYYTDNLGASWNVTTSGLVNSTPSAFVENNGSIFMSTLGYGIYKSTDNGVT